MNILGVSKVNNEGEYMKNKVICILVCLCMVAIIPPISAFANNSVSSEDAAARIGDVNYLYLNDAIDAVEDGETITLLKNWKKAVVIGLEKDVDFTLDLNGYEILVDNSIDAVSVYRGNVTIKNGSIENTEESIDEYVSALYVASNVEVINVRLFATDTYNSGCYVEDEATLNMSDCEIVVSGKGSEGIFVSYYGKANVINSTIRGQEYWDTSEFRNEQYGVFAHGDVSLSYTNIKSIDTAIYVESEEPVYIYSCTVENTDTAVFAYNSENVTIDKGEYHALTDAFYGENSKVVVGESTWSIDEDYGDAFRGEECVTLKSNVSPSSTKWGDDYWVKFYSELEKASVSKTASHGAKAVKVVWTDVPGAAKYEIYRSTKASSGYTRIKTVTDAPDKETYSYINTGRTRYKTYYYKVKAIGYNAKVTSTSGYKKIKVNLAVPKLSISCYDSGGWVGYKFNFVPGANGYQLYYKVGKNGKWKREDTVGTQENWHFFGYDYGKTYYFKMRAYDKVDGKKYYSSYSNIVKYYHKPPTVQGIKVIDSSGKAKLTWTKQMANTGYQVYRSTSKNGTYSKISTLKGTSKRTYTDSKVKKGKTYYYKVRAYAKVNGKTVLGKFSSKVKITF